MFKIILDPGHGPNYNPGAVSGYYEGNAMYELATYLRDELLKYADVAVTVTRKTISEYPTLEARTAMAKGADLFLSLHSNAFNGKACGSVAFYSKLRPESKALADNICNALTDVFHDFGAKGSYSRGGKIQLLDNGGDYYHVVREAVKFPTVKASFLIEHGFHDSTAECKVLNNTAALKAMAKAEAEEVAKFYGLKLKSEEKPKEAAAVYRVQVGAFSSKTNAENFLKEIKAKGLEGYIV